MLMRNTKFNSSQLLPIKITHYQEKFKCECNQRIPPIYLIHCKVLFLLWTYAAHVILLHAAQIYYILNLI